MNLAHNRLRFRIPLSIAILCVVIVGSWNYLAELFFQIRGGLMINDLLSSNASQASAPIACSIERHYSLDQKSRLSSAANSLTRATDYNHQSAQSYLLLGRTYCMLGKYESAVDAYKEYTRLRPKNPLGHLELGFAYEALAAQGSADLNEPFINLENIQPEQIKELWLIYRNDSAVNEWLSAGLTADDFLTTGKTFSEDEKYTEALTWYRRALWVAIDSAPTWIALADTLEESGNPQQARNAYWAAYFFNPEAGATDLVKALDSQIEASLIETILTKALQDYPQSDQRYDWWNILTSTLAEEERWSDVERISRQAIDENPAWSEFYIDLGWAIYNQKADWKSAIREFEKAIEINKSEPEGYFAIARLLTMESRYPEADHYYVLAIERKPGDRWYQVSWATNTRNSGNIPLAVEIFERILVQYPDYSHAYYEAALAYYLNEQLDKAKDAIEQAISLLNYQDQWYFTRAGAIFEAAGDINQALDYYQQALEVNPRNTTALEGVSRLGE